MGKKRIATKGDQSGAKEKASGSSRKSKKSILKGSVNVYSTYNNTIISLSDSKGEVATWASSGSMGFSGTKKSTPYAATIVAKEILERGKQLGLQEVDVIVRGIGPGREGAIRGIAGSGIPIISIVDDTPQPHNGVKAPKPRRV